MDRARGDCRAPRSDRTGRSDQSDETRRGPFIHAVGRAAPAAPAAPSTPIGARGRGRDHDRKRARARRGARVSAGRGAARDGIVPRRVVARLLALELLRVRTERRRGDEARRGVAAVLMAFERSANGEPRGARRVRDTRRDARASRLGTGRRWGKLVQRPLPTDDLGDASRHCLMRS